MKKILCFGDSNTWGCSPMDSTRFDEKTRWPMVMSSTLGENYQVIEEGLNGRTVLNLSPVNPAANGVEFISQVVSSLIPLDIVIISLGLNDVFISLDVTLAEISNGIIEIINIVRNKHESAGFAKPELIIMSPPQFNTGIDGVQFFELQINKLKELPDAYRKLSSQNDCLFFDVSAYVTGSSIDGSHLEAESHILFGRKISEFILDRIK